MNTDKGTVGPKQVMSKEVWKQRFRGSQTKGQLEEESQEAHF